MLERRSGCLGFNSLCSCCYECYLCNSCQILVFTPENFDMMVSRVTCVRTKKSLNMIISCVWMSVFNRENDLCSLKFKYRFLDYITNLTLTGKLVYILC